MKGHEPGDIFTGHLVNSHRANFFHQYEEYFNSTRKGKCRVYWGKHACADTRGNHEIHTCGCGDHPNPWSVWWGEDLKETEVNQLPVRRMWLQEIERVYSHNDDFDKSGVYRPNRKRSPIK